MNNLVEALNHAAEEMNQGGYYFQGEEGTYRDINVRANQFANQLLKDGFKEGDKMALLLGNSPDFISFLYGAWKIGLVVIPINPTYTPTEILYILQNAEVNLVVHLPKLASLEEVIRSRVKSVRYFYSTDTEFLSSLKQHSKDFEQKIAINDDQVAIILYTSGTTGKPKGAMLSHKNLFINALDSAKSVEMSKEDINLVALPMFHIFALTVCVNIPIVTQSKMIIMEQFSPNEFLNLVEQQKVTFFGGVPTMYSFILHFLKENPRAFSTITHCASGGAALQVAVLEAYKREFDITIQEGYGLSEGAGVVTINPRRGKIKPGTVGFQIGEYETKIVNELGDEVPRGTVGELICKGDNVFLGYYVMKEETDQTLRNGWLYTGDLAVEDEDGYISIVDRKKDLIIVGGYNVYPREVEEAIYMHPKIIEAGVVGEVDLDYGQKVVAFVVGKDGLTISELLDHCKQHLASYKLPKEIHFMKELPKTSSGKILRKNLSSKEVSR